MCDPSIMAIASMVSGVADSMGQAGAQAKQKQAYDEWFAQQEKNRKEQNALQERSRQMAEAAQQEGVKGVSAESQKAVQGDEQSRLTDYYASQSPLTAAPTAGDTTSVADKYLLTGQSKEGVGYGDLAAKITAAAKAARQRVSALAGVSSYGGSSGGLDQYVADMFQRSGETIDLANEKRRGDLSVYGVQQAVNPVQWSYTPGIRIG